MILNQAAAMFGWFGPWRTAGLHCCGPSKSGDECPTEQNVVERALSTVFKATGLFTVANYLRGECSSVRIGNEGYTFSLKSWG